MCTWQDLTLQRIIFVLHSFRKYGTLGCVFTAVTIFNNCLGQWRMVNRNSYYLWPSEIAPQTVLGTIFPRAPWSQTTMGWRKRFLKVQVLYLEVSIDVRVQPVMDHNVPCAVVVGIRLAVPPILKKQRTKNTKSFHRDGQTCCNLFLVSKHFCAMLTFALKLGLGFKKAYRWGRHFLFLGGKGSPLFENQTLTYVSIQEVCRFCASQKHKLQIGRE